MLVGCGGLSADCQYNSGHKVLIEDLSLLFLFMCAAVHGGVWVLSELVPLSEVKDC